MYRALKNEKDVKYILNHLREEYKNEAMKKLLLKLGFKFDNPRPAGLNVPDGFEFFYRAGKGEK